MWSGWPGLVLQYYAVHWSVDCVFFVLVFAVQLFVFLELVQITVGLEFALQTLAQYLVHYKADCCN